MSLTTDHEGVSRCDLCDGLHRCYPVLKCLIVAGGIEIIRVRVCIVCRYKETV